MLSRRKFVLYTAAAAPTFALDAQKRGSQAVAAPARAEDGLPAPILARLNAEMVKALNAPDTNAVLEENGLAVIGGSPEQFGALIRDGIERYGAIIKRAGIQPE